MIVDDWMVHVSRRSRRSLRRSWRRSVRRGLKRGGNNARRIVDRSGFERRRRRNRDRKTRSSNDVIIHI